MEKHENGERPEKENLRSGVGRAGEDLACSHLERAGFAIVDRNWTAWAAEIDVVARDQEGRLWFFEVKFRRSAKTGSAAESFTTKKRHAFFRAVSLYCKKSGLDFDSVRTGLVAIDRTPT